MTVVGLHPEELFDKLLDGEINSVERERLRAHLDGCEVCRFEYAARLDFQEEALALRAVGAPPASSLGAPQLQVQPRARVLPRRRRSRLLVWGLAAAALISASGAVASVLTGKAPWRAVGVMFAQSKTTGTPTERAVKKLARTPQSCAGADCSTNVPVATAALPETSAASREAAPLVERASRPRARMATVPSGTRGVSSNEPEAATKGALVEKEDTGKEPVKDVPTAAKLFGDANQARRSGDVGRASGLYHLLQDQYPGSPEAELSRVTLALLLLDSGDAQAALKGFERYLAGGSRGLEAEALVGRARALGRLGRRDLETAAWREVQRKFPRSIYGRQAAERLAVLGQP